MYSVKRVERAEDLDALRYDWNRLAGKLPMLSWEWMRAWWTGFGNQGELFVLTAHDGDTLVGILPLVRQRSLLYGQVLRFLGSDKASSDNLSVIAEREHLTSCAASFVQWLNDAKRPHQWDRLELDGLRADAEETTILHDAFAEQGLLAATRPCPNCWHIELPVSFDAYLKSLSKRMRKSLKDLDQDYVATGRAKQLFATSRQEAKEFLDAIAKLHQMRWKRVGIEGCFSHAQFATMCDDLIERLWPTGQLEPTLIEVDGRLVSGGVSLVARDEYQIYLVGMDPTVEELRPGFLLNLFNVRRAMALGKSRLNFLRGDEPYKQRLGAVAVPQARWVIGAPHLFASFKHWMYLTGISWMAPRAETATAS